jgi:CO/xanthine dehydrogenase Mo-binding subunit
MLAEAELPQLLRDPANHYRQVVETDLGDVDAAFAVAPRVIEAGYFTPFQMHGAMGASAAVADVRAVPDPLTGVQATIYSSSQNVTALRGAIARLLGYPDDRMVHVIYEEAAGCYGHNGADDVAADAALLSRAAGAPVRVQWTRQDEHGWEPLGGAQAHDMKGSIDRGGITGWLHRVYAPTAGSRPSANNPGTLLAGALTGSLPANLPTTAGNSSGRNCPVTYAFANQRVESRLVKSFETAGPTSNVPVAPLRYRLPRTSSLRSLGGFSNSFANESFFDELAHARRVDPLQLRIDSHTDERARAVLEALRPAWGGRPQGQPGLGAGVAYQQYELEEAYVATYAEVSVDLKTGALRITKVVCAHDCGLIVNPDGLRNQIEGNVIQGISRTLKEEVHYSGDRVTTVIWDSDIFPTGQYAVLSFDEVPPIETILIDRPHEPAWGAGEPAIGTIPGAIGNALFNATGARMRSLPMTPARVKATIDASYPQPRG